jgi:hypothetical protein
LTEVEAWQVRHPLFGLGGLTWQIPGQGVGTKPGEGAGVGIITGKAMVTGTGVPTGEGPSVPCAK